jgi:hypothetical protein
MRWFCCHDWKVQATTFAAPRDHGFAGSIKGGPGSGLLPYLERCANGVTTVLLACAKCGAVEKHAMLGAPAEANDSKA